MTLAERLTYSREHSGLSQSQAAVKLGISRSTLWRWEKGETEPTIAELKAMAEIYRCSECWLLNGEVNADVADGFNAILAGKKGQARVDLEAVVLLLSTLKYEGDND